MKSVELTPGDSIILIVMLAPFLFVSLYNYGAIIISLKKNGQVSIVPFIGGVYGAWILICFPNDFLNVIWWLPLVFDPGISVVLLNILIYIIHPDIFTKEGSGDIVTACITTPIAIFGALFLLFYIDVSVYFLLISVLLVIFYFWGVFRYLFAN